MTQANPQIPQQQNKPWEELHIQGDQLMEQVKKLIHEGNVQRIIVKHEGQIVVELPVTVGVIGAVIAPMLAAVGAVGALLTHCTIEVIRRDPA